MPTEDALAVYSKVVLLQTGGSESAYLAVMLEEEDGTLVCR